MIAHPRLKEKLLPALLFMLLLCWQLPVNADVSCNSESELAQALHLPVCCWANENETPKAIILAIHGATLYAGTFDQMAKHLAENNYPVYAADMRGFGRWQKESAQFNGDSGIHYTQSRDDLLEILATLHRQYPNKRIYCLGESLGANLAIWIASNHPELVDGIILSSPCIKAIWHPRPRLAVDITKGFFDPNKPRAITPHIKPILSNDQRVTQAYINDPEITHSLSAVAVIKSMKTNKLSLQSVQNIPSAMPILIVAGKKDRIYSAKAIPRLAEELGSQNKTIVIEPNRGHLLLETKYLAPEVISTIDSWLDKNSSHYEEISRIHLGDSAASLKDNVVKFGG